MRIRKNGETCWACQRRLKRHVEEVAGELKVRVCCCESKDAKYVNVCGRDTGFSAKVVIHPKIYRVFRWTSARKLVRFTDTLSSFSAANFAIVIATGEHGGKKGPKLPEVKECSDFHNHENDVACAHCGRIDDGIGAGDGCPFCGNGYRE